MGGGSLLYFITSSLQFTGEEPDTERKSLSPEDAKVDPVSRYACPQMRPSLGTESIPRLSSQGSEVFSEEEGGETVRAKDSGSLQGLCVSRHHRGAAHRNSQCLC